MPEFRVVWTIDIDADDAHDAACRAWEIQQTIEHTATVYEVTPFPVQPGAVPEVIDLCIDGRKGENVKAEA